VQFIKISKLFTVISLTAIVLLSAGILQAKKKNPYSYLSNPPISIRYLVSPDKAEYDKGEIIELSIIAELDSAQCDPNCAYRVYFGKLAAKLTQSEMVNSKVEEFYNLSVHHNSEVIAFDVKMLQTYTPPLIEVETVRLAPTYSTAKKQFMNIVIDQYAREYITSPEYIKVRKGD